MSTFGFLEPAPSACPNLQHTHALIQTVAETSLAESMTFWDLVSLGDVGALGTFGLKLRSKGLLGDCGNGGTGECGDRSGQLPAKIRIAVPRAKIAPRSLA